MLAAYCRQAAITRLEVLVRLREGRQTRQPMSILIATFSVNPGLRFFAMEDEMAAILAYPCTC